MSDRDKRVTCEFHGETDATFVCRHVAFNSDMGFHTSETPDDPRPDAWCSACDKVLRSEGEWNDRSEKYAQVSLLCAGCYDVAAMRNRRRDAVLDTKGFVCATCGAKHHTLPLDFGADEPDPYRDVAEEERSKRCFLTKDVCVIDDQHFFVRGCLEIPLIDAPEALTFGVWGSHSEAHFKRYMELWDNEDRIQEPPYFSWLCTSLPLYPETYLLKSQVLQRPAQMRPFIRLEPTDHPLAVEQRTGIPLSRAIEIAGRLMHLQATNEND